MSAQTAFTVLLVLACPLMMLFMMRGHGHGHGHVQGGDAHAGGCHDDAQEASPEQPSLDELRERVNELQAQISALEEQARDQVPAAG